MRMADAARNADAAMDTDRTPKRERTLDGCVNRWLRKTCSSNGRQPCRETKVAFVRLR